MRNYSNPWAEKDSRKEMAVEHTAKMGELYGEQIEHSIQNTKQYFAPTEDYVVEPRYATLHGVLPEIEVVQMDSVQAAMKFRSNNKAAILDFASYKNPGGMFLEGSIAQEEALCHESFLFNVLSSDRLVKEFYEPNRKRLNKSLYHSNVLYVPDVLFEHNETAGVNHACERFSFDVIVAAAPNKGAAQKYQNVSDDVCDAVMRHRIRMVLAVAEKEKVKTLILGAFGCGVFKNDPETVARIFREELRGRPYRAVFAVPGDKFTVFKNMFGGHYV